jgi:predicted nucleotidyltransferase
MLDQLTIQNIVSQIKLFEPKRVILFGSQASGHATPESDVDLLVIKDIPENNVRQLRLKIKEALWVNLKSLHVDFDIIVDSEERILKRIELGDSFYEEIYNNGITLYA